jgi:iron-sulfur cluster repair protein YtfE (RIC family)
MQAIENCCPNCVNATLTAECTVNAAVAKTPTALQVFREYGIDTCCGGGLRIADAAALASVSAEVVLDALTPRSPDLGDVAAVRTASCGCGCGGH